MFAEDLAGRDAERDGRERETDVPVLVLEHFLRLKVDRGDRLGPLRVVDLGRCRL